MSDTRIKRIRVLRGFALAILAVLFLTNGATLAEAQLPPQQPAFSSIIESVSPGTPFVTCIQGQFEQPQPVPAPPGIPPHLWYIRAKGSGTLNIEVRAVSVNPSEVGSITARLFDGTTQIASVNVPHPNTTAGAENVASMAATVQAPKIYRLEVLRAMASPTSTAFCTISGKS
jgi:hypothetical protein